jgi:hypothetical protein
VTWKVDVEEISVACFDASVVCAITVAQNILLSCHVKRLDIVLTSTLFSNVPVLADYVGSLKDSETCVNIDSEFE